MKSSVLNRLPLEGKFHPRAVSDNSSRKARRNFRTRSAQCLCWSALKYGADPLAFVYIPCPGSETRMPAGPDAPECAGVGQTALAHFHDPRVKSEKSGCREFNSPPVHHFSLGLASPPPPTTDAAGR